MAQLLLTAAGSTLFGPIGGLIGNLLGGIADRALLGGGSKAAPQEGPRLSDLKVTSASEGAPIPRLYGRMRVSTQLIWATNLREQVKTTTTSQSGGGKATALLGGSSGGGQTATTYLYFCSFALGLCEGEIQDIAGVWADGKPLDMSLYTFRLYKGTEDQEADPKIQAIEGEDNAPAFRGTSYIVFEEMPLERFGNRIPQITIEVIRQPAPTGFRLEDELKGVTLIPGLSEFVYSTDTVYRDDGFGNTIPENQHGANGKSDFLVSLDQLQSAVPNIDTIALVVGWLGTDLRASECEVRPKVEYGASKKTTPWSWKVSGIDRSTAIVVSTDSVGALLGGAPADRSVYQAIEEIKSRGLKVLFYCFVIMDIPPGNTLPNPYSNGAAGVGQPTFPWRGKIGVSPAIGFTGTPDKTATAATQVNAFFGTSAVGDFGTWNGDTIPYTGPNEWKYRRLVLHYAKLCQQAGLGVDDAFLIGSELTQLTQARSAAGTFPAVAKLVTLIDDVRSIVGSDVKIGYGANWDEYANYRPSDGSNDVYFHLDPLWSAANLDFIGIDNYLPISDWRDGRQHLDAQAGAKSIYDIDYLQSQLEGGELYDYYYASSADRDSQTRTPVIDGAYGKHWVFRYKDFRNWWENQHYNRPGGVEDASPTSWVPESKPIWFTEFGCPAIDKATNQPNVFFDPKSSDSGVPYYSNAQRDDLIQRAYFDAIISYWLPINGNNPVSGVYGEPMIDTDKLFAWSWDARPYPQFPNDSTAWRDVANYRRGHWLNGRLNLCSLADVVKELTLDLGVAVEVGQLSGLVRGYVVDSVMSPRSALQPLMQVYFFDAVESDGAIKFVHRGGGIAKEFTSDDIVDTGEQRGFYQITRGQETDLPRTAHLKFIDPDSDYLVSDVYARRLKGSNSKTIELTPSISLDFGQAQGIVENILVDQHVMRERAELTLPPSAFALEPTDVISLDLNGRFFEMRIAELGYQHMRPAKLVRTDAATYGIAEGAAPTRVPTKVSNSGPVILHIMDLPLIDVSEVAGVPRLAAYAEPWARCAVYRSPADVGFALDQLVINRTTIGVTTADFYPGDPWLLDTTHDLYVQIPPTQLLESITDEQLFAGGNLCALKNSNDDWELLQFGEVEQTSATTYRLSRILRGQAGTEFAIENPLEAGAPFVMLTSDVVQSSMPPDSRGRGWNMKWGPSDKPLDDPTYQAITFTPANVGMRPLSPVHLQGVHGLPTTDDWILKWKRRTRIGGDSWDQPDVPLGEEQELYDVEILDPADDTVLRTVRVTEQQFVYTAAMQTADFGALQTSSIKLRVYQVSIGYGRGIVAEDEVTP